MIRWFEYFNHLVLSGEALGGVDAGSERCLQRIRRKRTISKMLCESVKTETLKIS